MIYKMIHANVTIFFYWLELEKNVSEWFKMDYTFTIVSFAHVL